MFTMCSGCTFSDLFNIWHSGMEFTIHKCCQPRPGSKTIKVFSKKTPESGLGVEPWSHKWTNKHSIRYHLADEGPIPLTIILRGSNRTGFTSRPSTGFLLLTQRWWIHPQCLFEYVAKGGLASTQVAWGVVQAFKTSSSWMQVNPKADIDFS